MSAPWEQVKIESWRTAARDTEEAARIVRKALEKVQQGCKVRLVDPASITAELFKGTQGRIVGFGGGVGRGYKFTPLTTELEVYYWKVGGAVHLVVDARRSMLFDEKPKEGWVETEKRIVVDRFPELEAAKGFSEKFLKLKKIKAPKGALLHEYDPHFNAALVSVADKMYFCTEFAFFQTNEKSIKEVYGEIRSKIGKHRLSRRAKDPKKELRKTINKYIAAQLAR